MSKTRHTRHITDVDAEMITTRIKLIYHTFLSDLQRNPEAFDFDKNSFHSKVVHVGKDIDYLFVDQSLTFTDDEMDEAIEYKKHLSEEFKHNSSDLIKSSVVFGNSDLNWIYNPHKSIVWNTSISQAIQTRKNEFAESKYKMLKAFNVDFTTLRHNFESEIKDTLTELNTNPNENPFEHMTVIRSMFSPKLADFWNEQLLLKAVRRYIHEYNAIQNKLERQHPQEFNSSDPKNYPDVNSFRLIPYDNIYELS